MVLRLETPEIVAYYWRMSHGSVNKELTVVTVRFANLLALS